MNKFSSRSYPHSAYNHLILGYPSSGRRKWVFFMGWIEIICYGPEGKPFRILREFEKNSRPDQDGTSIIFDTFISFQTLITAVLFPQSWIMKLISPRGYIVGVRDTLWPVRAVLHARQHSFRFLLFRQKHVYIFRCCRRGSLTTDRYQVLVAIWFD